MSTSTARSTKRTTRRTVAVTAVLALAGAGAAFAYWTASGEGDGQAETGVSEEFIVTVGTAAGLIEPGGPGAVVPFTVTNNASSAQEYEALLVVLADENGDPWVPPTGCLAADYNIVYTDPGYANLAPEDQATGTITVTLDDTLVNQDACQDADVPLHFIVNPPV